MTQTRNGKSITVPGVLLVGWPDRLRLEVQDPVGSLLALLVVNGDRFWLYQQDRKENLTGPLQLLPRGAFPQISHEEILRLFLAKPDLEPFKDARVTDSTATTTVAKVRQSLTWARKGAELTAWKFDFPDGASASVEYEDYSFRSGAHYPTKIRFSRNEGDRENAVQILWNEWESLVPKEKKLFQIPQEQQFGRPTKALP